MKATIVGGEVAAIATRRGHGGDGASIWISCIIFADILLLYLVVFKPWRTTHNVVVKSALPLSSLSGMWSP